MFTLLFTLQVATAPIDVPAAAPRQHTPATDIVIHGRKHEGANDPLEELNVKSFELTEKIDKAVTQPVAVAYRDALPEPARDGVRNFLNNLSEPITFINFMLQVKPGKAAQTAARFVLNSSIGIGGAFDVAKRKPFRIRRRVNGLAYTLGYYGVKPGPFLFVPLVGPTTVRDLIGTIADRAVLPYLFGAPFTKAAFTIPVGVLSTVDRRAQFDDDLEAMRATIDPYVARRDYYLRKRQRDIDELRGVKSSVPDEKILSVPKREPEPAAPAAPEQPPKESGEAA